MTHNRGTWDKRCEARLVETAWALKWTDGQCSNHKAYNINGKQLCGRHAALEALAMMVAEGVCRELPSPCIKRRTLIPVVKPRLRKTGVIE